MALSQLALLLHGHEKFCGGAPPEFFELVSSIMAAGPFLISSWDLFPWRENELHPLCSEYETSAVTAAVAGQRWGPIHLSGISCLNTATLASDTLFLYLNPESLLSSLALAGTF